MTRGAANPMKIQKMKMTKKEFTAKFQKFLGGSKVKKRRCASKLQSKEPSKVKLILTQMAETATSRDTTSTPSVEVHPAGRDDPNLLTSLLDIVEHDNSS